MIGQKFGRLTILSREPSDKNGRSMWLCQCDCGNKLIARLHDMRRANTRSCGCLKTERWYKMLTKHGHAIAHDESPTYLTWRGMKDRCCSQNHSKYKDYGGRGIQICERWQEFANFLADMGERPTGLTIHRIDNDGNYEPGNCKWATAEEQRKNKRPNCRLTFATINGETKSLYEWDAIMGFKPRTLRGRIRSGWKNEDLLKPKYWRYRNK